MMRLNDILRYVPRTHGEHGVDATIHGLLKDSYELHEAYSNPPGGSWAELDIIQPNTGSLFRWDHIPRVAREAKRPDSIVQYNEDVVMNILLIESKKQRTDYYEDMKKLMIQYFTGSNGFNGLKNRPAWHNKPRGSEEWIFMLDDRFNDERYWFQNINDSHVNFFAGFSYALTPEHYSHLSEVNFDEIKRSQEDLLNSDNIDIIIGMGWYDQFHYPFTIITYDDGFERTSFGKILNDTFFSIDYNHLFDRART